MDYRELSQIGVEPEKVSESPEAYRIRITSNGQSLAVMENLVKEYSLNPRIRAVVAGLIKKCKEKDYDCYVNQITSFVRENVKYVNDPPRTEVFQSPIRTLELGIGDCDDFAVLTAALLRAAGFEAKPVIKKASDRWGHVVVALYHPEKKQWLEIDTTKAEDRMSVYELGTSVYELGYSDVYELGFHWGRIFKRVRKFVKKRVRKIAKRVKKIVIKRARKVLEKSLERTPYGQLIVGTFKALKDKKTNSRKANNRRVNPPQTQKQTQKPRPSPSPSPQHTNPPSLAAAAPAVAVLIPLLKLL